MDYQQLCEAFVRFFEQRQHTYVPSASLIPAEDKTLMFTNAGMNQFKDVFCGYDTRSYSRAISVQRCVRAGGKHNDLDNVGYTSRHHTFFEMLGNFSFGDYFKEEAIEYSLDFLVKDLGLKFQNLLVTVHQDDNEAYQLWRKHGFSEDRVLCLSDKDNFWAMGDTGPCGPCSEIFYDLGDSVSGGLPGSSTEGERFKEIWNLVFMQFLTSQDSQRHVLPKPCVDTGMGLERLASVIEGVDSNFKTSFFVTLKDCFAQQLKVPGQSHPDIDIALNVLADHFRASCAMIHDGMRAQNEGRGYVLRRIIRRALRYGYKLGAREPFLHKCFDCLAQLMGHRQCDFAAVKDKICDHLIDEQEQFFKTLEGGMKYLEKNLPTGSGVLKGEMLFKLYDTYGFPLDIAADIAKENSLQLDVDGYQTFMAEQKERSRQQSAHQFQSHFDNAHLPPKVGEFVRDTLNLDCAKVTAIFPHDSSSCYLTFDSTPFYALSGGQVGDSGTLVIENQCYEIKDTIKQLGHHLHYVLSNAENFTVGSVVSLTVDSHRRQAIERHHSATHLLHAALRQVLGTHVEQKGSLVTPERLRFDFSHPKAPTDEQIEKIERLMLEQILSNQPVVTTLMPYQDALEKGAMAFFDDKYGDEVRVLQIGKSFSIELCGGTHVTRCGDIGLVKIIDSEAISAGVRRLQAVAGFSTLESVNHTEKCQNTLARTLECSIDDMPNTLTSLIEDNKSLKLRLDELLWALCRQKISLVPLESCGPLSWRWCKLDPQFVPFLRQAGDLVRSCNSQVDVFAVFNPDKSTLVIALSKDLKGQLNLKTVLTKLQEKFPLKGGGRDDRIQAGAALSEHDFSQLKEAIALAIGNIMVGKKNL